MLGNPAPIMKYLAAAAALALITVCLDCSPVRDLSPLGDAELQIRVQQALDEARRKAPPPPGPSHIWNIDPGILLHRNDDYVLFPI
jgi:hypothetical protein